MDAFDMPLAVQNGFVILGWILIAAGASLAIVWAARRSIARKRTREGDATVSSSKPEGRTGSLMNS